MYDRAREQHLMNLGFAGSSKYQRSLSCPTMALPIWFRPRHQELHISAGLPGAGSSTKHLLRDPLRVLKCSWTYFGLSQFCTFTRYLKPKPGVATSTSRANSKKGTIVISRSSGHPLSASQFRTRWQGSFTLLQPIGVPSVCPVFQCFSQSSSWLVTLASLRNSPYLSKYLPRGLQTGTVKGTRALGLSTRAASTTAWAAGQNHLNERSEKGQLQRTKIIKKPLVENN